MGTSQAKDIVAVCCYFNPCHYQSKRVNYHRFKSSLKKHHIRLITIELAFNNENFELESNNDTIKLRSNDIFFLQHCLYNIGIQKCLKEDYKYILWLDADIEFIDQDWVLRTMTAFQTHNILQLYTYVTRENTEPFGPIDKTSEGSISYFNRTGIFDTSNFGFAWGAKASILKQCPLFDATITGSGDIANVVGFYYNPENTEIFEKINSMKKTFLNNANPEYRQYFYSWAQKMGSQVQGKVGYIDGSILTMYHGTYSDRNYKDRHHLLKSVTPERDIKKNPDGLWTWYIQDTETSRQLQAYFYNRKEDRGIL